MNLFSRIAGWFRRSDEAPLLRLAGLGGADIPVWWANEALPLNLWVDGGLAPSGSFERQLFHAARAIGHALMLPVDIEAETRNAFFANRATFRNAVVIQPYETTASPGAFKCTFDIRYDRISGEMRNGLVEWNLYPDDDAGNVARLMHELGHVCGLGHCDGTVMQAMVREWAGLRGFNTAQQKYLRGLRA